MSSLWIEKLFFKRECSRFFSSHEDGERCACGLSQTEHCSMAADQYDNAQWDLMKDTRTSRTDSYGLLEFQGDAHPEKAQYVRLDYALPHPQDILRLLVHAWKLEPPRFLITLHGGPRKTHFHSGFSSNADYPMELQLKRALCKGIRNIMHAAGSWMFTNGENRGITHLIKEALAKRFVKKRRGNVIGITSWGTLHERQQLLGRNTYVKYQQVPHISGTACDVSLSDCHNAFLLVDNGIVGKPGAEAVLRKKLENYLSQRGSFFGSESQMQGVPAVCLLIGGDAESIMAAASYLGSVPPVPVVMCEGSGGAADLLALACRLSSNHGGLDDTARTQLLRSIKDMAGSNSVQVNHTFTTLCECVKKKSLVSSFSVADGSRALSEKSLDFVILTALLKRSYHFGWITGSQLAP